MPVIHCATIVRCRVCRTYINPFVYFVDNKRWKCTICFRVNERKYHFINCLQTLFHIESTFSTYSLRIVSFTESANQNYFNNFFQMLQFHKNSSLIQLQNHMATHHEDQKSEAAPLNLLHLPSTWLVSVYQITLPILMHFLNC